MDEVAPMWLPSPINKRPGERTAWGFARISGADPCAPLVNITSCGLEGPVMEPCILLGNRSQGGPTRQASLAHGRGASIRPLSALAGELRVRERPDKPGAQPDPRPRTGQLIAAFIFGTVFVIVMLVLALCYPNPTSFQYTTFRIVLALAASGVAAMIPGFIHARIGSWLRASGAIAVFALVYLKSPAALTVAESGTSRHAIAIALQLPGLEGSCPQLPAAAQLLAIPAVGAPYPAVSVEGCKATLIVPADAQGPVRLSLLGAGPYELVRPTATYPLEAGSWQAAVSDTPNMHLRVSLYAYSGRCDNLQSAFDTFQEILKSKASALRNQFAITDHRYDYLSQVKIVTAGQPLNMSPGEIRSYLEENGLLQILSGVCVARDHSEVMRSSIFNGSLAGPLPDPLVADLSISEREFGATRDIYTATMLYALSREAESRRLDQDLVISYLERARSVARRIKGSAGQALRTAIDSSLHRAGAPAHLPL